jgi:hypothetical protein
LRSPLSLLPVKPPTENPFPPLFISKALVLG